MSLAFPCNVHCDRRSGGEAAGIIGHATRMLGQHQETENAEEKSTRRTSLQTWHGGMLLHRFSDPVNMLL